LNIREHFHIRECCFLSDRPEAWRDAVTGEDDAALDEAGTADTGAGGQLDVHSWTAS